MGGWLMSSALRVLREQPGLSAGAIADALQHDGTAVRNALKRLRGQGLVSRDRSRRPAPHFAKDASR